MGAIKLGVNQGGKSIKVEIQSPSDSQTLMIIDKVFKLLGLNSEVIVHKPTITVQGNAADVMDQLRQKQKIEVEQAKQIDKSSRDEDKVRPRSVTLVNSERSMTSPLGEKLTQAIEDKPEWFITGIKYKDGEPHYRCRYYCKNPKCMCKSNQYIKPDEIEVSCHQCGQRLRIRQATANKLERDGFGNYFIAEVPVN